MLSKKIGYGENIVNKYLVSGNPKTEYYLEIGGSINSE